MCVRESVSLHVCVRACVRVHICVYWHAHCQNILCTQNVSCTKTTVYQKMIEDLSICL